MPNASTKMRNGAVSSKTILGVGHGRIKGRRIFPTMPADWLSATVELSEGNT